MNSPSTPLAHPNQTVTDWLILGAGISGLVLGSLLLERGDSIQLLEKSRGIGGRLATRRVPLPDDSSRIAQFDHGLPVVELNQPEAVRILEKLLGESTLNSWSWPQALTWGSSALRVLQPLPGMNALAKAFPASSQVHRNQKVTRVQYDPHTQLWKATTQEQVEFSARRLVSTLPIPQLKEILRNSPIQLEDPLPQELHEPEYISSINVLVIPKEPPRLRFTRWPSPSITLLLENQWKGISESVPCITLSISPERSQELFEQSDEAITQAILSEIQEELELEPMVSQVHRWRYAQPLSSLDEPFFTMSFHDHAYLHLCGDYFGPSRISPIERAILSAHALFIMVS